MSLFFPDCTFGAFHHCVGLCCLTMCSTLCCAMCFRTIFTPLHSSATTLVHLGKLCQPCFCISQIPQHGLVIVCWQTFRELSAFGMQLQTDRCTCLSSLSRMYLAGHELQSDFAVIVIIIVVVIMIIIIIIVILLSLILSLSSSILLLLLSLLCAPQRHFPEALATNRVLFLLTQQHLMHKCRQECIPFLKRGEQAPRPSASSSHISVIQEQHLCD